MSRSHLTQQIFLPTGTSSFPVSSKLTKYDLVRDPQTKVHQVRGNAAKFKNLREFFLHDVFISFSGSDGNNRSLTHAAV